MRISKYCDSAGPIFEDKLYEEKLVEQIEKRKRKKYTIIVFTVLLLSILFFFFSIYFAFIKKRDNHYIQNVSSGDIFIVCETHDCTKHISSFANNKSLDNANIYTFYVENNNEKDINYKIVLDELTVSNEERIDKKNLNYQLTKNDKILSTGNLSDLNGNILARASVNKKSKDYLKFKLWDYTGSNKYFKYRIVIE